MHNRGCWHKLNQPHASESFLRCSQLLRWQRSSSISQNLVVQYIVHKSASTPEPDEPSPQSHTQFI
jgi:hypothetical protein